MFFSLQLRRSIQLHPKYLGKNLKTTVADQLKQETVGRLVDGVGYVVIVLDVEEGDVGRIDPLTGFVKFDVEYRAIMFRPFTKEVLDVVVSTVASDGFFAMAGPQEVFVYRAHIPEEYVFNADEQSWVSSKSGAAVKSGSTVRVRLGSSEVKNSRKESGCMASIHGAFLGPVEESSDDLGAAMGGAGDGFAS